MPRQSAPTLQPSTQLIGRCRLDRRHRLDLGQRQDERARPGHLEPPVGSVGQVDDAGGVRGLVHRDALRSLRGLPRGEQADPRQRRHGLADGGQHDRADARPDVPRTTRAGPGPASRAAATVPALLCASGFSLHGISVRTSASREPGLQAVLDVGELDPDVHQDRADQHVGQVPVRGGERPRPRVPVEGVEEPGRELHEGRGDEHEDRQPLDGVPERSGSAATGTGWDRPTRAWPAAAGCSPRRSPRAGPGSPGRPAPGSRARAATTRAGTGSGSASRSRSRCRSRCPGRDRGVP